MRYVFFAIIGLLASSGTATVRAEQRLADYRRVVIPDRPGAVQKVAAEELARYVGRISGRKLEVVPAGKFAGREEGLSFFVGEAVASGVLKRDLGPWKEEEWLLRTVPGGLVVAGHDGDGDPWSPRTPAGCLLAVYTLLDDHLGVRWFWPGPFGEHVPEQPDATLPAIDVRSTPPFMIRSVGFGYSRYHTKDFREDARRWARRARQGWGPSAGFGDSWD